MRRHPVQNARGRTHGVGAVKFHAGSRAAHGHSDVAAEHRVPVLGHGKWSGKGLEIRGGVVVTGARDSDVLGHDRFALLLELFAQDAL